MTELERHEYKTVPVLQYEVPRGTGDDLARICEHLEGEGWTIMSANAVGANGNYSTTSFVIVARRNRPGGD